MKSAKELLELAAKAVCIEGNYTDFFSGDYYDERNGQKGIETKDGELWNPLDYNDEALSLAVDLGLYIFIDGDKVSVDGSDMTTIERFKSDKRAATRRAIVRAAAAIGADL